MGVVGSAAEVKVRESEATVKRTDRDITRYKRRILILLRLTILKFKLLNVIKPKYYK